jgi:hypothetical protein
MAGHRNTLAPQRAHSDASSRAGSDTSSDHTAEIGRVLVLDGGGMRGLATIRLLKELMRKLEPFADDDALYPYKSVACRLPHQRR